MAELSQILVQVADLDEARRFYGEVLQLPHLFDAPRVAGFELGGVRLLLAERPGYSAPNPSGIVFYLRAAAIETVHRDLLGRGAGDGGTPHQIGTQGSNAIWIAFVRDPSGNMIGLQEERPG
jgi:catechol 2,3-dioxygenase-like lactoylglutathione lyase family enzyme